MMRILWRGAGRGGPLRRTRWPVPFLAEGIESSACLGVGAGGVPGVVEDGTQLTSG